MSRLCGGYYRRYAGETDAEATLGISPPPPPPLVASTTPAMASSSVSQESLDTEDFQLVSQRRSRVRPGLRCRAPIKDQAMDGGVVADDPREEPGEPVDHDSPTRGASRGKEKRGRPLHLYKGKTAKEKRKLREKRRSTGVLHFPTSTEVGVDGHRYALFCIQYHVGRTGDSVRFTFYRLKCRIHE